MELVKVVIFGILYNVLISNAASTEKDKPLIYNCFHEDNEKKCEDTRIQISEDFYLCDLVVKLDSPPKRIGHKDGIILFSSEGKTFKVNSTLQAEPAGILIPMGDTYDQNGNMYYDGDGTTYAVEKNSGKEVEIVTTGEHGINQHTIDVKGKKLFILTFDSGRAKYLSGRLFSISTDPLSTVNGKAKAEIVNGVSDSITSFAVDKDRDFLLLGMVEELRGKLVRLKRLKFDPCSKKESTKISVLGFIMDIGDKIIQLIEKSPEDSEVKLKAGVEENIKILTRQNSQLKRELKLTKEKLGQIYSHKIPNRPPPNSRPQYSSSHFGQSSPPYIPVSYPKSSTFRPSGYSHNGNSNSPPASSGGSFSSSGGFSGIGSGSFSGGHSGGVSGSRPGDFGGSQLGEFSGSSPGHFGGSQSGGYSGSSPGHFGGSQLGGYSGSSLRHFEGSQLGGYSGSSPGHFGGSQSGGFSDGSYEMSGSPNPDNFRMPYSCIPRDELEDLYAKVEESNQREMDTRATVSEVLDDLEGLAMNEDDTDDSTS